jgi:WD40 repeat protein
MNQLAVSDAEGRLSIYDSEHFDADPITIDRASESGGVWAIVYSPDGTTLATGGDDHLVRLWDPVTGRELTRLKGHESKVHAVAFSPDGQTLASGDFTGKILLWHAGEMSQ